VELALTTTEESEPLVIPQEEPSHLDSTSVLYALTEEMNVVDLHVVIATGIPAHARAKTDGLAVLAVAETEESEMPRTTGCAHQLTNPTR